MRVLGSLPRTYFYIYSVARYIYNQTRDKDDSLRNVIVWIINP